MLRALRAHVAAEFVFSHAINRVNVLGTDLIMKGIFGRLNISGWLLGRDCDLAGCEHKGCGPTNRLCGGSAGMVGITRAAVYPMRNYVYRLVTTGLRLIIPLSLPGCHGPKVAISSPATFSSVQAIGPMPTLGLPEVATTDSADPVAHGL